MTYHAGAVKRGGKAVHSDGTLSSGMMTTSALNPPALGLVGHHSGCDIRRSEPRPPWIPGAPPIGPGTMHRAKFTPRYRLENSGIPAYWPGSTAAYTVAILAQGTISWPVPPMRQWPPSSPVRVWRNKPKTKTVRKAEEELMHRKARRQALEQKDSTRHEQPGSKK